MSRFHGVKRVFRLPFVRKGQTEREVDEELRFHLDKRAEELVASGITPDAARDEALRQFGDLESTRAYCRRMSRRHETTLHTREWLVGVLQDVRYAVRTLSRSRAFALAAVLTLALGIGVNSAVFSLANWIVLRAVPGVHEEDQLVVIEFSDASGQRSSTSYPNFADLRRAVPALSDLAGSTESQPVAAQFENRLPQVLHAGFVSANYFAVIGSPLALGRSFTYEEEAAAMQSLAVVISHDLWTTALRAEPAAVGMHFTVNGDRAIVVGVAPLGFRGTDLLGHTDLWLPGTAYPPALGFDIPALEQRATGVFTQLLARLAPGASHDQLRPQIETAHDRLSKSYPGDNANWGQQSPRLFTEIGVPTAARPGVNRAMLLLAAIAALVLLIACANVANMFLFKGVNRQGELAVRRALGASTVRLIRAHVTEFVVLALVASALSMQLARWAATLFRGPLLPGLNDVDQVRLDWRVVGFTALVSLATVFLAGLAPTAAALRTNVSERLKTAAATAPGTRGSGRNALAVFQLALSLSLVVVSILLVGTLRNLRGVDLGFDPDRISTFMVWPGQVGYERDTSQVLMRLILPQVKSIPGVEAVGLAAQAPFSGGVGNSVRREGSSSEVSITDVWISSQYFRAMDIQLLMGRTFDEEEVFVHGATDAGMPIILSQSVVQRLFGDEDPVGQTISSAFNDAHRVIGVVEDSRWSSLVDEGQGPTVYHPMPVFADFGAIYVRSTIPFLELKTAVQREVAAIAPGVPVFDDMRLSERIDRHIAEERLLARLLTAFSLLALLLAGIGLYAVVSFSVAQRTRELGIRVALGAQAAQIMGMVLREGTLLGAVGTAAGALSAVAMTRLVASRLFGLSPLEPKVYALAAAVMFLLVLIASFLPARRATRVNPVETLRVE